MPNIAAARKEIKKNDIIDIALINLATIFADGLRKQLSQTAL